MRIIAKTALREFWMRHPDAEGPLLAWHQEVKQADWNTPAKLKEKYGRASIIGDSRVIFNIKGSNCRLVVKINHQHRVTRERQNGSFCAQGMVLAGSFESERKPPEHGL